FRVQEEIAGDVSRALLASVQGLRPLSPGSRTEQPAAYDAYLRGTYWRQLRTRDGLLRAIDAFEEALVVDSAYAPAYAGLSSVLSLFVLYQYSGGPEPVSALARAIVLADRAIALDPNLAEGFAARGWALTNAGVSVDTAVRDLARAVALRPNSGQAHSFYVAALGGAGPGWPRHLGGARRVGHVLRVARGCGRIAAVVWSGVQGGPAPLSPEWPVRPGAQRRALSGGHRAADGAEPGAPRGGDCAGSV